MKTLGERLKAVRELRKLSQEALGEKVGIIQYSISLIEKGGNTKYIIGLADALGCDPVWLETGRGFSPFSKTLQFMSGCIQVPLINGNKVREFLSQE